MKLLGLLLSSVLLGCLSGCGGGEHEDIKQWMAESSRDMKGGIPPLPELKPFPIVSYDASDQADPFSSVRLDPEKSATAGANQPDMDRPREQPRSQVRRLPLILLTDHVRRAPHDHYRGVLDDTPARRHEDFDQSTRRVGRRQAGDGYQLLVVG